MSQPYPRYPDQTFMVTRKCTGDYFLLRPSELNRKNFLYILAVAQHHYPVLIHGYCFMSNHVHLVITDPTGKLGPDFIGYVNSLVARSVNSEHGLKGAVWDSTRRPNWCALTDKASEFDKLVYTLVNPVAAGLVEKHQHWPGLISTVETLRKEKIKVRRPKGFFPEKESEEHLQNVVLRFSALPGARELPYGQYISTLKRRVQQEEKRYQELREKENRRVMGADAVMAMPVTKLPAKRSEPAQSQPKKRRKRGTPGPRTDESLRMKPRAAGSREALSTWLRRYDSFQSQYHAARKKVVEGIRDAVFPLGTYQMHVRWGFAVAAEEWVASPMAR